MNEKIPRFGMCTAVIFFNKFLKQNSCMWNNSWNYKLDMNMHSNFWEDHKMIVKEKLHVCMHISENETHFFNLKEGLREAWGHK